MTTQKTTSFDSKKCTSATSEPSRHITAELIACPFCKGQGTYSKEQSDPNYDEDRFHVFVKCRSCGARGKGVQYVHMDDVEGHKPEIAKYWNSQPDADRLAELEAALEMLVNSYVCNRGTDHEFISCKTPKNASAMTLKERQESETWLMWDKARIALGDDPYQQALQPKEAAND